jgi:VIT1/CCC1 family predicted Fe2+/Mn2+ transporter
LHADGYERTNEPMSRGTYHLEGHRISRVGWLRAIVLGANDGLVSTASLIVGVAAATPQTSAILVAGGAGLVAGAMSMAAGEYVSVSSQHDTEQSDLARERRELKENPTAELAELASIYEKRGLDPALALQVATKLTAVDAFSAHARDELGITDQLSARPLQAAVASALAFAAGALLPLLTVWLVPAAQVTMVVSIISVVLLAVLGAIGAHLGGARLLPGTIRVTFWGAMAMLVTALIGHFFGAVL